MVDVSCARRGSVEIVYPHDRADSDEGDDNREQPNFWWSHKSASLSEGSQALSPTSHKFGRQTAGRSHIRTDLERDPVVPEQLSEINRELLAHDMRRQLRRESVSSR